VPPKVKDGFEIQVSYTVTAVDFFKSIIVWDVQLKAVESLSDGNFY